MEMYMKFSEMPYKRADIEKIKNQLKQKDTTWSDLTHRL